jgi:hypothetical protein
MAAIPAQKFYVTLATIHVFPARDLDGLAVDKGICDLVPCLLQVIPERLSRDAHRVSGFILLNLEEVAEADRL